MPRPTQACLSAWDCLHGELAWPCLLGLSGSHGAESASQLSAKVEHIMRLSEIAMTNAHITRESHSMDRSVPAPRPSRPAYQRRTASRAPASCTAAGCGRPFHPAPLRSAQFSAKPRTSCSYSCKKRA